MDKIDVELVPSDTGNVTIQLILNDTPVNGIFDPFAFIGTQYKKFITTELMTCSCGVAGCAGIFEGTKSKIRKYSVEWRDIDSGLPKRFHSFDKKEYMNTIQKCIDIMYDLAKKRESGETPVDAEIDRYDLFLSFGTVADLERTLEHIKYWYTKYAVM